MREDVKIYGIKNCQTMKKAFDILKQENIAYDFIDYKKEGLSTSFLDEIFESLSFLAINKQGTTFKKLEALKHLLESKSLDKKQIYDIILENPSVLKRPICKIDSKYYLGLQALKDFVIESKKQ